MSKKIIFISYAIAVSLIFNLVFLSADNLVKVAVPTAKINKVETINSNLYVNYDLSENDTLMIENGYSSEIRIYDTTMTEIKYSLLAPIGLNQEVVFKNIDISQPYNIIVSAPYDMNGDGLPDQDEPYELARYEYQPQPIIHDVTTCKDFESIGKGANYPGANHNEAWLLDEDYNLTTDIDCSETENIDLYGEDGFDQIGQTYQDPFSGTLNGNGYSVNGLYTSNTNPLENDPDNYSSVTCIFTFMSGEIYNIHFDDLNIENSSTIASGLIGFNLGELNSVSTSGLIENQSASLLSGLVSINLGTINNSYSSVNIKGNKVLVNSGFVGLNIGGFGGGIIRNSYSTGKIETKGVLFAFSTAGLIGINYNGAVVNNCYSTSNVDTDFVSDTATGNRGAGGLVGINANNSEINNSYATGNVSGKYYAGGLVGYNNDATINNSYVSENQIISTDLGATAHKVTNNTIVGVDNQAEKNYNIATTSNLKNENNWYQEILGWDLDQVWDVGQTDEDGQVIYPHLKNISNQNEILIDNTILISTCHELENIGNDQNALSLNYQLANNIDCNETKDANKYGSDGFNPIGDIDNPFTGNFDGHGYSISNLYINAPNKNNQAIFGYVDGGTINNFSIYNISVNGNENTGGLVGYIENGQITNSYVNGEVNGSNNVGLLIGRNALSIIEDSYTTGTTTGQKYVGGVVGNSSGNINNTYSIGKVIGESEIGGLAGIVTGGQLTNSFSATDIESSSIGGGLVGQISANGLVENSYAYDKQIISLDQGQSIDYVKSEDIIGLDTSSNSKYYIANYGDLTNQNSFYSTTLGWNTNSCWKINDEAYYPHLKYLNNQHDSVISNQTKTIVRTCKEVEDIGLDSSTLSKNYMLGNDIDCSETKNQSLYGDDGFKPIGTYEKPFNGSIDGYGYSIDSLYINNPTLNKQALIGYASFAKIERLGLTNVDITGYNKVGGLVGETSETNIYQCFVTGDLKGNEDVGGLVGRISSGKIYNSYTDVQIDAYTSIGGLAGSSYGDIYSSYSTGEANGFSSVGGLVGYTRGGHYNNCFSSLNINEGPNAGGLIGYTMKGTYIDDSYSYQYQLINGSNVNNSNMIGIDNTVYPEIGIATYQNLINQGNWYSNNLNWNTKNIWEVGIDSSQSQAKIYPHLKGLDNQPEIIIQQSSNNKSIDEQKKIKTTEEEKEKNNEVEDKKEISTCHELENIGNDKDTLNQDYILVNDIDCQETHDKNLYGIDGFNAIGTESNPFTGSIDGQGFTIDNLYINNPTKDNQGLIGYGKDIEITNLKLTNLNIIAKDYSGALVGYLDGGIITKNDVQGNITNQNDPQSLVGFIENGTVENNKIELKTQEIN